MNSHLILSIMTFPHICLALYGKENQKEKEELVLFSFIGQENGVIHKGFPSVGKKGQDLSPECLSQEAFFLALGIDQVLTIQEKKGCEFWLPVFYMAIRQNLCQIYPQIENKLCFEGDLSLKKALYLKGEKSRKTSPQEMVFDAPPVKEKTVDASLKNLSSGFAWFDNGQQDFKPIQTISVLSGSGPFTALRAGLAFAQGLAFGLGMDEKGLREWDLFSLYPPEEQKVLAIHTGIPQWILQDGSLVKQLTPCHREVSAQTFSFEQTLKLSMIMASQTFKSHS